MNLSYFDHNQKLHRVAENAWQTGVRYLAPFSPILRFSALFLVIASISRIMLSAWMMQRFDGPAKYLQVLENGLKVDLSTLAFLLLPAFLLLGIAFLAPELQRPVLLIKRVWMNGTLILFLFLELCTPLFIKQFDVRPNRLFLEYLDSPAEIASTLFHGFALESLFVIVASIAVGAYLYRLVGNMTPVPKTAWILRPLYLPVFIALLAGTVIVGRGGLQHRPINPAMVAVGSDRLVNSLALNSTFSVIFAIYGITQESALQFPYGEMPWEEAIGIVRSHMDSDVKFLADGTYHGPKPFVAQREKPKNLVMIVQESLGSTFVASHGGYPVTPNLEKWRHKSWFFDNLYATGIRSARGLEALTAGFPPSHSRAVLKLPRAQENFFTLASYLKRYGYESSFIYGGESHFDNMKGFFLNNGFERVIDENDYEDPMFHGSWGVSDEDLFKRSLEFLESKTDSPQFVLIFTSSNHPPYEFPEGRIELYNKEVRASAVNTAKYADYALGKFLDNLDSEGFLESSTVLVVADHEDKVFGSSPVPLNLFHIPAMILDPNIEPKIDNQLASQLDLAPTLLSLLGTTNPHPMIGHDLTKSTPENGRVISQFGDNQAFMTDDCTVFMQPGIEPQATCPELTTKQVNELKLTARAHAVVTETLYKQSSYNAHVVEHQK